MNVTAGTAVIPVDEYLRTTYEAACDYIDGVLRQKPMPAYEHSKMELRVAGRGTRANGSDYSNEILVPDVARSG